MNIAILGYGKMGHIIQQKAADKGHDIVYTKTSSQASGNLEDADVAIEFSVASAAPKNLETCFEKSIPVVCGTTGWLKKYEEVAALCKKRNGALLYASNFSVGVNLFFSLNKKLAELMAPWSDYSVAMEEIHHTEKQDAPSGTAITLAEDIIAKTAYDHWNLGEASSKGIPIMAKRKGDVKGTHNVTYASEIDTISITHEAHSRDGFALGAILAAEWIQDKKGIFSMKDVLQMK
ncbi:4-hydroxy-tetrahydrodipicolinate reductase [Altibacter sp. HG106]|uniref:4-hydroxy-tetrahydrodipicolinate reductase n=1 Tax=Altibacter sp. HG106 TaxID=3023937 RepID=UPI0023505DAF|nr:4-hydroxy-tetrahydrodipicolinate reductase [Altibacter sp. HG106]MDC7995542.1 4-hydroxy-tetrahydrodipicolinate reductase [Altibacter sp. HG106]